MKTNIYQKTARFLCCLLLGLSAHGYSPTRAAEAITEGGADLSVKRFQEFMADPINRYASVDLPLREGGQRLLDEKKPEQAAILFEINAAKNPHSFQAYYALAEAYRLAGKLELARRNYKKSLEINPKNYDVVLKLEELEAKKQND